MYETGADDSPMWDNAKYQEERWTMNLNSLSLNCYMAMDAEHLANIAKELGKEKESVLFTNEYNRLKQLVNEKMWDENRGFYYGFYWNGEPNLQKGPGNFLPLLSGIASPGRAAAIVKKMNDTSLFWGEHVLPTISKDHPAFPDQQYWRGSIWPPSNYFAYQGLKRYQFDSLAHHFALKSTNMFMENYEKKGGACNENFDTRTGQGQGQKYQSWGPLFAMLMVEEFIDFEPWGGLRFGSFYTGPASLENLLLDGDKYSLKIDKGMEFSKNGVKIVQTDINAVVRNFVLNKKHLRCEVHAKEPGQFLFVPQNKKVKLKKGMNIVYFKR
jgi:glycogen debranching enzyme